MKRICITLIAGFLACSLFAQETPQVDQKLTTASNMRATVSNLGLIGNSFSGVFNVLGYPSLEFPVGSGIEHVFDGGLWIGGSVNGQIAVSTGAIDDPSGYETGKTGFEFTPLSSLGEASSLQNTPFFNPSAISHQDFSSTFTDTAISIRTPNGSIPIQDHLNPLGVKVEFSALNWNFDFANFFIIMNYKITNINTIPIDSVYLGFWMDGVIRNINITPAGSGGSAFYNKGGNNYIDSLNLAYEFDATGDIGFTDSYVGIKYLGSELNGNCPSSSDFRVNFNTWLFRDATSGFPQVDNTRYLRLRSGINQDPNWETTISPSLNAPNNRSNLVSVGPYPVLNPGETIEIAYAIVCARRIFDGNAAAANTVKQRENLIANAEWAQTAYDGEDVNRNCILDPGEDINMDGRLTRYLLPTPPPVPITKIIADENAIDIFWSDNAEAAIDAISQEMDFEGYRVYKTSLGFDTRDVTILDSALKQVASWDTEGNKLFFDTGFDAIRLEEPVTFEGDTNLYWYKYSIGNVADGWQHAVSVTAFDKGDDNLNIPPLESTIAQAAKRVFTGKPPNSGFANGDPFVYPNPYYAIAAWEGASRFEEDKKLMFANLPPRCEVRIYTVAGDLVDVFEHNEASYNGSGSRWFETYSDTTNTVFSGGEHAWDLLSQDTQILARGLYLFVVKDLETNEIFRGKFVLIK